MPKRIKFGWVPALPDARAYAFAPKASIVKALPASVDLRASLPPVWNQGSIGSCVAHGVAIAHIAAQRKNKAAKEIMPARLALYFQGRAVRGWQAQDSGMFISDAMKCVAKLGVADEKLYPYLTTRYLLKPPAAVYANGLLHQSLEYQKIDSSKPDVIKAALAEGLPVVFGSTLYENHGTLVGNVMPDPDLSTSAIGGHCMALVGYDSGKKQFLVRNSWGKSWGDNGHHWVSEKYICDLSLTDDVWVLKKVEA
jgi:C1A family cysteine protease